MLAQLLKDYPQDVRFVFRHFPLTSIHPNSAPAARAAEAAGLQGKFWEMKDALFEKQEEWSQKTPEELAAWLEGEAKELGLDVEQFKKDLDSQEVKDRVDAAEASARELQIPGTPFLLANGAQFQENPSYEVFSAVLDLLTLKEKQFDACPPMTVDPAKHYSATLKTTRGDFKIELYPDKAPLAVNSFVFLARQGWYDGVPFHRVLKDFVAQGGDPSGSGAGGPGYAYGNEISDLKYDQEGMVGLANAGADSNGSQFFITYTALPDLDGKYTIFGKVVEGMDVVKALTPRDPGEANPPAWDTILSVSIEEK